MPRTILVTGASSGFGAMIARALADAGDVVYAGMRDIAGHNAQPAADAAAYPAPEGGGIHALEMDVTDQPAVDAAIARVIDERGSIDVLVHNAGHMVLGPVESFTVEQVAEVCDVNVLSTQRVNRAALPHMREAGAGLVVWIGSTSTRGGTPPYLGPYFAAKAGMDSLAVSYAAELTRFGIDTVIVVPGSFTTGTNHFAHAGHPDDAAVRDAYDAHYAGLMEQVGERLARLAPPDADPNQVAVEVARVVALDPGTRPFRVHIDPADDGASTVSAVADELRIRFYERIGLADLLSPTAPHPS